LTNIMTVEVLSVSVVIPILTVIGLRN